MSGLDELRAMLANYEALPVRAIPDESYYPLAYEAVKALPALIAVADAAEKLCNRVESQIAALGPAVQPLPELLALRSALREVEGEK